MSHGLPLSQRTANVSTGTAPKWPAGGPTEPKGQQAGIITVLFSFHHRSAVPTASESPRSHDSSWHAAPP
jgi:hypothetical protein